MHSSKVGQQTQKAQSTLTDVDINGGIDWDKTGLQVLGCLDENATKLEMLASRGKRV